MDSLLSTKPAFQDFIWPLEAFIKDDPKIVYLSLKYDKGRWRADREQVEAVLSLWRYARESREHGEAQMQLLGPSTVSLYRDYAWWVKRTLNPIIEIQIDKDLPREHEVPDELRECSYFGNGYGRYYPSQAECQNECPRNSGGGGGRDIKVLTSFSTSLSRGTPSLLGENNLYGGCARRN